MSSQKSNKKNNKKFQMDSEVTRAVLVFLLFLVIVALLVAAFMSLGHGTENSAPPQGNILHIEAPTEEGAVTDAPPVETVDPNHGNTETQPIPAEVLNPELATTESVTYVETAEVIAPPETMPGETAPIAEIPSYMTTGVREGDPSPVYIQTESELATLAPPLTTAGDGNGNTTFTETVAQDENQNTPDDGSYNSVNYVVSLSGSSSIYSSPNGSSTGTVGTAGSFTIVQEMTDTSGAKWGKLKSGAGWVRLN